MKKKSLLIVAILFYFEISCNSREIGNDEDFDNGYSFVNKGSKRKMILPPNFCSKAIVFPDVVDYSYDSNFILAEQHPNRESFMMILGSYLYEHNLSYISFLRDPKRLDPSHQGLERYHIENDSFNYKLFKSYNTSTLNSARDVDIRDLIADSLLRHDPYYIMIFDRPIKYWIIQVDRDTLFGPFDSVEYKNKKRELNISQKLNLKFEQ